MVRKLYSISYLNVLNNKNALCESTHFVEEHKAF